MLLLQRIIQPKSRLNLIARRLLISNRSIGCKRASSKLSRPSQAANDFPAYQPVTLNPLSPNYKPIYPPQLLIYHAGTARIVYIGFLKLTTGFIFLYFLVKGWSYWSAVDPNYVMAVLSVLNGAVPALFVYWSSRPFVSYLHLRLSPQARLSKQALNQYARRLPKNATLEITTLNTFGLAKVSLALVSDLQPVKQKITIANYGRDTTRENAIRPWWAGKARDQFLIRNGNQDVRAAHIWDILAESINARPILEKSKK